MEKLECVLKLMLFREEGEKPRFRLKVLHYLFMPVITGSIIIVSRIL